MNKLRILAGCLAAVTGSAVAGALATDPDSTYYRTLDKPSWQPPPPVYGIVWTPLYLDIALSAGHAIAQLGGPDDAVATDRPGRGAMKQPVNGGVRSISALPGEPDRVRQRRGLIIALGANLALNTAWSWLFFRIHRPWLAAAECAVLTASSVDLVRRVGAADRRAGVALAPYPAWCAFATALTVAVARRNPRSAIAARLHS